MKISLGYHSSRTIGDAVLGSTHLGEPDPARPLDLEASRAGAGLPAEAAFLVEAYQRPSKADATVRAYRSDAEAFEA